jgi:hypothetical protein
VSIDKSFPYLRNIIKHVRIDGTAGILGSCLMHHSISTKRQLKRYAMPLRFALLGRFVFGQPRYFLFDLLYDVFSS